MKNIGFQAILGEPIKELVKQLNRTWNRSSNYLFPIEDRLRNAKIFSFI